MTIAEFLKQHPEFAEGESETKRYKEYHTKIKYLCQCKNGHLFDYRERVRYSDSDKHHASCNDDTYIEKSEWEIDVNRLPDILKGYAEVIKINNKGVLIMKGYKVFKPDWTCRDFQYAVGETFEEDVTPLCCNRGFHFCTELKDCFNYYHFDPNNKVAEVEALGVIDTETDGNKHCTNKIKIVREILWDEVLELVNTGKANTGLCNSGDYNKTNFSSGCFNTEEAKILMFNKPSNWTFSDWLNSEAKRLLDGIQKNVLGWIWSGDMTAEEKKQHPDYKTTGGYLKKLDEPECGQSWWDSLSDREKGVIKALPNFDAEIFKEITGINTNVVKEDNREVHK